MDYIGYIYKTTVHNPKSSLNGCYYYGQHFGEKAKRFYPNPDPLYFGSGVLIQQYIKKYGRQGLENAVVRWYKTEDELNRAEKEVIGDKFDKDSLCLNRQGGGAQRSAFSKEIRLKMSQKRIGKKPWHAGKTMPESFRKACSEGQKRLYASGYKSPMTGKTHTEETRAKLRAWAKAHPRRGRLNPAYGMRHTQKTKDAVSDRHSLGVWAFNRVTGEEYMLKNLREARAIFDNITTIIIGHQYTYGRLKDWRFEHGFEKR